MIILHVTKTKNETLARFLIFPSLSSIYSGPKLATKASHSNLYINQTFDYRCEMRKKTIEEWKTKSIFNRFDKKVNLCGGQNLKDPDKHII